MENARKLTNKLKHKRKSGNKGGEKGQKNSKTPLYNSSNQKNLT